MNQQSVLYHDLGLISFADAWEQQRVWNEELKVAKKSPGRVEMPHHLVFCEHPPVFTLGKSGKEDHLKIAQDDLESSAFEFFRINRGGDITYHGPGQIVGYPIFDLERFFTDVHRYVRSLEEVVIRTLAEYAIRAGRLDGYTGVWLDEMTDRPRKICAIGVHLSRWVTMHGFALNVNTNLEHFTHIIPCGIDVSEKPVTSLSKELGRPLDLAEVKAHLRKHFAEIFAFTYLEKEN